MQHARALKAAGLGALVLVAAFGIALAHGDHEHKGHAPKAAYGEPGDPRKPAREVVVVMTEGDGRMLYEPATIVVKTGEQVRFKFRNDGALDHEFLLGTQAELDEHADMMKAVPDMKHDEPNAIHLAPKASGELVWRFTNAGEFPFACLILGHREAGMAGKVVVR